MKRKACEPITPLKRIKLNHDAFKSVSSHNREDLKSPKHAPQSSLRVFCRLRPAEQHVPIYTVPTSNTLKIEPPPGSLANTADQFEFTHVFDENACQAEVAASVCEPAVRSLFEEGKNSLIFAYGITNAGKTHTVIGTAQDPGLIPRALEMVVRGKSEAATTKCNFYEIYNENIYDLLTDSFKNKPRVPLKIRQDGNSVLVSELTSRKISSFDEGKGLLELGMSNRRSADTGVNATSSRSHSIFTIHLEQPEQSSASITFVDLAGAERQQRTRTEGERLKEASHINCSLMTLSRCLETMKVNQLKGKNDIIPFRDCKLTRIFSEYFSGLHYITIVINVNPRRVDFEETVGALRFAAITKDLRPPKSKIENSRSERRAASPSRALVIKDLEEHLQLKTAECESLRRQLEDSKRSDDSAMQQLIARVKNETRSSVLEECSASYERREKASSESRDSMINSYTSLLQSSSDLWASKLAAQTTDLLGQASVKKEECGVDVAVSFELLCQPTEKVEQASETTEVWVLHADLAALQEEVRQLKAAFTVAQPRLSASKSEHESRGAELVAVNSKPKRKRASNRRSIVVKSPIASRTRAALRRQERFQLSSGNASDT